MSIDVNGRHGVVDANDPRLTAFALGELDGDERAAVEAAVRGSAALRAEVEAVRACAGLVAAGFATEAAAEPVTIPAPIALAGKPPVAPAAAIAGAADRPAAAVKIATRQGLWTPTRAGTFLRLGWVAGGLAAAGLGVVVFVPVEQRVTYLRNGAERADESMVFHGWDMTWNISVTPKPSRGIGGGVVNSNLEAFPTNGRSPANGDTVGFGDVEAALPSGIDDPSAVASVNNPPAQLPALYAWADVALAAPRGDSASQTSGGAPGVSRHDFNGYETLSYGYQFPRPRRDPSQRMSLASVGKETQGNLRYTSNRYGDQFGETTLPHDGPFHYSVDPAQTLQSSFYRSGAAHVTAGSPLVPMLGDIPMIPWALAATQAGEYAIPNLLDAGIVVSGREQDIKLVEELIKDFANQNLDEPLPTSQPRPYVALPANPFKPVSLEPLSTFSIDVDTAAYANVRRHLMNGQLPPGDAVRVEEMINYFDYDYSGPVDGDEHPFAASIEVGGCPWTPSHRLVRVAVQGREMDFEHAPNSNLVFLIDVSGSMQSPKKLPLVKEALKLLIAWLGPADRVAMVVYAGAAGEVLPSTTCEGDKRPLLDAIDQLEAGGSTDGGAGIALAYDIASRHFIAGGVNRVLLLTDGDWNVGITDEAELTTLIQDKAASGVFLSVLGFDMEGGGDGRMETLADKGNGNYAFIDTLNEARKVLVEQLAGTLITIAKDVKIQVEFNPAAVGAYRLIGYENRLLAAQDFNDDTKDAGEIGAGHSVTVFYEIVPAAMLAGPPASDRAMDFSGAAAKADGSMPNAAVMVPPSPAMLADLDAAGDWRTPLLPPTYAYPAVDPLKYQTPGYLAAAALGDGPLEMLTLKLRYQAPDGDTSTLVEFAATDGGAAFEAASTDFRFAASVAGFGMLLRQSPHRGAWTMEDVIATATNALGADEWGYRAEFVELARKAQALAK